MLSTEWYQHDLSPRPALRAALQQGRAGASSVTSARLTTLFRGLFSPLLYADTWCETTEAAITPSHSPSATPSPSVVVVPVVQHTFSYASPHNWPWRQRKAIHWDKLKRCILIILFISLGARLACHDGPAAHHSPLNMIIDYVLRFWFHLFFGLIV